jgi:beta-lactamase regulating signal transducer with metallopeptidase domain
MEYFTSLIPETLSKAIGFTVLHSLWQICLVSLIYYIVVKLFVKDNSRAKYNLAIISLFSCLTISVISFIYFFIEYKTVSNASNPLFANTFVSGKFSFDKFIQENLSLISGLWLMGSALFFAKFSSGVLGLYNLKHNAVSSSDKRLAYLMNGLKKKLNITEEVSILESHNIISPVVLGYARPLILFPVAMCSQLSINELESVIAHELAHIKRNDFIINLLQSCTEAIPSCVVVM